MDTLQPGQELGIGQELTSNNGRCRLVMQGDGNLVLYRTDNGEALWASNTPGTPANRAVMQGDGNFVVYKPDGPVWASHTEGNPGARIVLQDDGNLVIYSAGGPALWASGTVTDWSRLQARTGDCRLATARWMNSSATMSPDGNIEGTTRIWCRWQLRGFHGSVAPVVFDADGRALWPETLGAAKHQYGVDGTAVPFSDSDRTERWSNTVPPHIVQSGKIARLGLVQFLDPKSNLFDSIKVIGEVIVAVVKVAEEVLKQTGKDGQDPGNDSGVIFG